jgi:hypothetical protein
MCNALRLVSSGPARAANFPLSSVCFCSDLFLRFLHFILTAFYYLDFFLSSLCTLAWSSG